MINFVIPLAFPSRVTSSTIVNHHQRRAPRPDPDADTWQHDLFKTNKLDYGDDPSSSGAADSSAAAADEGPRSTRLKITNLHYEVSEQELRVGSRRQCIRAGSRFIMTRDSHVSTVVIAQALFEQVGTLAPPAGGRETSNPAIKVRNFYYMNRG